MARTGGRGRRNGERTSQGSRPPLTLTFPPQASGGDAAPGAKGLRVAAFRVMAASADEPATPVQDAIRAKVTAGLDPTSLEIVDDSASHAGHAHMVMGPGRAGKGGETHFKLSVVSDKFAGLGTVQRHRLVYQLLAEELRGPVHALNLDTKTPSEVAR